MTENHSAMMTLLSYKPSLWCPHWGSPCHDDSTTLEAFGMTIYHKVQYAMMTVMQQKPFSDDVVTEVLHAIMTVRPQKPWLWRYIIRCTMPWWQYYLRSLGCV